MRVTSTALPPWDRTKAIQRVSGQRPSRAVGARSASQAEPHGPPAPLTECFSPPKFEHRGLASETERRRAFDGVLARPSEERARCFSQWPLAQLLPIAQYVEERLFTVYSNAVQAIDSGDFDLTDPEHCVAAYLMVLRDPHAVRFLMSHAEFGYDEWAALMAKAPDSSAARLTRAPTSRTDPARSLLHEWAAECAYLAFEARQLEREILRPGLERARALGRPLMLVANLMTGGASVAPLSFDALRAEGVRLVSRSRRPPWHTATRRC